MHMFAPPEGEYQVYTQGYWDAVIAAVLYFFCALILLVNMLGYFLGHYPQRFELTEHQRTLILQTMLFFFWLAGGAAMFSHIEARANPDAPQTWAFVDALYFCDVTILTVGFGDLFPVDNLGRGLVFPYSVGGIIMLGLVISSLHKFAAELGQNNIVQKHIANIRSRTYDRTVTESSELTREQEIIPRHIIKDLKKMRISAPHNARRGDRRASIYAPAAGRKNSVTKKRHHHFLPAIAKRTNLGESMGHRKTKLILLKEERDRFNAMRDIQKSTARFKRWWALSMSIASFCALLVIGAIVFWQVEQTQQGMTYFQALYFCYISLLTIGYGDLAPKSNAGRSFFVVWSLIAVPTMTILISDMSDTVIDGFKEGTFKVADFTVMPQKGVLRDFIENHPKIRDWIVQRRGKREQKKRLQYGMQFPDAAEADETVLDPNDLETPGDANGPCIEALAREAEQDADVKNPLDEGRLARRLATAIRNVAGDLRAEHIRKYSYEEWAELTRLIRFTSEDQRRAVRTEERDGMVDWDWIGENSPMMSGQSEPEFVLDRLCESLARYVRRSERRRRRSVAAGEASSRADSDYDDEPMGPLTRNATWDQLEGRKSVVPNEKLPFDSEEKDEADADYEMDPLGRLTTHHADNFANAGDVQGRYDHEEEIGPMDADPAPKDQS